MTTIFIPLLDEGTDVFRPTEAVPLGGGLYRVLATPDYNPEDEHWKFPPGSTVACAIQCLEGEEVIVAEKLTKNPS